jgi:hypothetical protein
MLQVKTYICTAIYDQNIVISYDFVSGVLGSNLNSIISIVPLPASCSTAVAFDTICQNNNIT